MFDIHFHNKIELLCGEYRRVFQHGGTELTPPATGKLEAPKKPEALPAPETLAPDAVGQTEALTRLATAEIKNRVEHGMSVLPS